MASGSHRGLPILSGEPPLTESSSCVSCGKDFNPLWRRPHSCGHCGYSRCSSCMSDGQALMPRRGGGGYDVEDVCLFCLSMLQVTAASLTTLRSLPIKRLKDYLAAYDIKCVGPKEKEDFVQAVVKARSIATGCLPPENESYFRRKSVPRKGVVIQDRQEPAPRPQASQPPRPPPARPPQQPRPSAPNGHQHRPPPPNPQQYRPPPPQARPPPARTAPTPAPKPAKVAPPPVPTILSLVPLPISYLQTLSIGTLKAILFENHVKVDFKQVLEKDELVARVSELIRDERNRLERQRLNEEREARGSPSPPPDAAEDGTPRKVSVPTGPVADLDRGLCVVCQDEEAVLAVVDCGHLAMCPTCSDLIMATSRECPLCRTRIVTDQRLIRIYRT